MFLDTKTWNITLDSQLKWQKSGSEYNLPFSCRNQLLFIRNSIESRSEYVTSSTCTLLPCQYLLYVVTYNLPNELKNFIASLAGPWYTVWPFPNKHSVSHNLNIEYLGWWIEKMMVFPRSANLKVKVIALWKILNLESTHSKKHAVRHKKAEVIKQNNLAKN